MTPETSKVHNNLDDKDNGCELRTLRTCMVMADDDQYNMDQFQPSFYPGESCEDIYNINIEDHK